MFSCTFISCSLINNSSLTVNVRHFLDQQITSTCEKQKLPLPCVHQMFFSSSGFLRYRLLFSFVSLYLTHIVCGSIIGLLTQHGNTWQQKYVLSMLMSVKNSWFLCRIIFGPVSAWKRTGVRANVFFHTTVVRRRRTVFGNRHHSLVTIGAFLSFVHNSTFNFTIQVLKYLIQGFKQNTIGIDCVVSVNVYVL